jgi:hypothetical protein
MIASTLSLRELQSRDRVTIMAANMYEDEYAWMNDMPVYVEEADCIPGNEKAQAWDISYHEVQGMLKMQYLKQGHLKLLTTNW